MTNILTTHPKAKAFCPTCNKTSVAQEYRPFCSARCKSIDLGHWLSDAYVIAGEDSMSIPEAANDQ